MRIFRLLDFVHVWALCFMSGDRSDRSTGKYSVPVDGNQAESRTNYRTTEFFIEWLLDISLLKNSKLFLPTNTNTYFGLKSFAKNNLLR